MHPVDRSQKHTEKNTINLDGAETTDFEIPKSEGEPSQGDREKRWDESNIGRIGYRVENRARGKQKRPWNHHIILEEEESENMGKAKP